MKMNEVDVMEGLHNAHTGIASDTPVSVHLIPHLTKCGDSVPYEERFIRVSQTTHFGMVGPTLEWWVLLAHLGINGSFNPLPWMKHE